MNPELIQKTQKFLFASEEEMIEAKVPANVRTRILRLRDLYTFWLNTPALGDKVIVAELRKRYGVSLSTAYEDIRLIKICLGNLNQQTTDYYRWVFLQRVEEAFQMARLNNDARAFSAALACLGKYTKLDKDESERPDYSAITPQSFEITADAEVAGFKRIPNLEEKTRKLLEKYSIEVAKVDEFQYEELPTKNENL